MKITRILIIAFVYFLISIPFIYTAAWYAGAFIINQQINAFIAQQAKTGILFSSKPTYPIGFPWGYRLSYSGEILTPLERIKVEQLEISGWPMTGQTIHINAPQGIMVEAKYLPYGFEYVDFAELYFVVPDNFPAIWAERYIQRWQQEGHAKLILPYFKLQYAQMGISGKADIWLNDALQPEASGQFTMENYNNFLNRMAQGYGLNTEQTAVIFGLLSSVRDPETGEITLPFSVKNSFAYISMLQVGRIPTIQWPSYDKPQVRTPVTN